MLLAADGHSTRSIAEEVGVQPRIVSNWRRRFADHGLGGLKDCPRAGKKPIYGKATNKRILALLDKPPPRGYARWTGPLLATALDDVDVQYVWRFLREHNIDLVARKSWCESNDPQFVAKAADVVGLYVDPPAKAIVLCVDEKPSIQALERAQGYLKLPNGRALTGQSHDYKRHGTTTLFAALEVATGRIIAAHSKRRRRVEFLGFMNSLVDVFPDRELHVIVDNLNTHKKNERWLKKHPKVQFHFTPTRSSWLNQVEIWFSVLQGQSLNGASFTAVEQLQQARRDASVVTSGWERSSAVSPTWFTTSRTTLRVRTMSLGSVASNIPLAKSSSGSRMKTLYPLRWRVIAIGGTISSLGGPARPGTGTPIASQPCWRQGREHVSS